MNVEQDRLYRRRILEEVRPLGSRRTIYYGHVPPARDRQPSEGCPRAALRLPEVTVIISLTLTLGPIRIAY